MIGLVLCFSLLGIATAIAAANSQGPSRCWRAHYAILIGLTVIVGLWIGAELYDSYYWESGSFLVGHTEAFARGGFVRATIYLIFWAVPLIVYASTIKGLTQWVESKSG